ncbi:MAG: S9 family peptidase [Cyclobacteriaceae bacterium]
MIRLLILLMFLLPGSRVIAQNSKLVSAADLMKIVTVNQLHISPDGTKAVGVVNRKSVKNKNEYYYTRHLWVFDLNNTNNHRQLTFGDRNDGSPQWSPDGKNIAFTRTEGDKTQIWILPVDGGEAYVLTKSGFGAFRPRWSPDGKKILFQSLIPRHFIAGDIPWAYERPGRRPGDEPNFKAMKWEEKKKVIAKPDGNLEEVRAWLARNASESNPRVINRLNFQGEMNLQPDENFSHLYYQSFPGNETPVELTSGFRDFNSAEWSPDGKSVITVSKMFNTHPDQTEDHDLWIIDLSGNTAKEFLKWEGYDLGNPAYSPDGSRILFRARPVKNRHAPPSQLGVVSSSGGKPEILTRGFDRDVNNMKWSADGKSIFFNSENDGFIPVYRAGLNGKTELVLGAETGINEFDLRGNKIIFAQTKTENPWELGTFLLNEKSSQTITGFNGAWLKEKVLSLPKSYRLKRPDGTTVQYWVMEPAEGAGAGKKYPVILNIHGGPSAMWGPGVFSMWHEFQTEAAWGYGIVYCNPRGSGGYGDAFKKGNFQDWGTGPSGDILASLEDALQKHSWMDKDQLFVEGGSYAGYMVSWIIGHDNRFKAANAQRGVYDLETFLGEGNAWRLVPTHFGGYPWSPGVNEVLEKNSPINYIQDINTPLLIIHGDQDLRTGVIQSEMLYKSLKILNKPVEYIRYPKEGHELTRSGNPGRMMDHLLRIIEFFERYAKHP